MSLATSYLVGLLGVALLAVAWVAVQNAWRRVFPGAFDDPDVLAGRTGCHACSRAGCTRSCGRVRETIGPAEEEDP